MVKAKRHRREVFQILMGRTEALYGDLVMAARAARTAPPAPSTVQFVRELHIDIARFVRNAPDAPRVPKPPVRPETTAAMLPALGQLKAVLVAHGQNSGEGRPITDYEISAQAKRSTYYRLAALVVLGIEHGVQARMAAIEKGEDPEEAYTIAHTYFYKCMLELAQRDGIALNHEVPRLAIRGEGYDHFADRVMGVLA